ncbi:MAG TPA: chemotaxis protein [Candidatus Eisenbacteria bacterium]|nr:chemotaxis protein [Candidatus Eisenbacteria bacterium]
MPHKLAIAFLHGIGRTEPGYSEPMRSALLRAFASGAGVPETDVTEELVFEEVNWSPALSRPEAELWRRVHEDGPLRYGRLRDFMVHFAGDAIAYQPSPHDRSAYDAIHEVVADSLASLAARAGARAPLCVIAHSLGTVIASNYLYDLMKRRGSFMGECVRERINGTPLERGETLALLVTMGSPIALWSLRYPRFGEPVRMPCLERHHPGLHGRWINVYDPDDVIGYPLRGLNAKYRKAVTEDRAVDVGSLLTRWTPLSHTAYWGSRSVAETIADHLAAAWRASSAIALVPERRTSRRTRRPSATSSGRAPRTPSA